MVEEAALAPIETPVSIFEMQYREPSPYLRSNLCKKWIEILGIQSEWRTGNQFPPLGN